MPTPPPKKVMRRVVREMKKRYRQPERLDVLKRQTPKLPPHSKLPRRNVLTKPKVR